MLCAESGTVYEQKKMYQKQENITQRKRENIWSFKKEGNKKMCKYTFTDNGHTWARTNNNMVCLWMADAVRALIISFS